MLRTRLLLAAICAVAVVHGVAYLFYQQPDWNVAWTDQGGYRMLGHGLAVGGGFTRYPGVEPFVPEAIRLPMYPLFVSLVYRIAGESQTAVVLAQIGVFAAICLLVFVLARRILTIPESLAAALVAALYSPFPYFAALVLTELWTVFAATATIAAVWRAIASKRLAWYFIAGVLFGCLTLSRPVFVLLGPFVAGLAVLLYCRWHNWRREILQWSVTGVALLLTLSPWLAYNYRHFGIIDITPVGLGRPVFESSWQGIWAGRVQASITEVAEQTSMTDEQTAAALQAIADQHGLDTGPMHVYVSQWRRIHNIWDTPTDPQVRFRARIIAQEEYLKAGLDNIRKDMPGFWKRRILRGQFILWAADIPVRFSDINALPTVAIRAIWFPQALMMLLAIVGTVALARGGRWDAVLVLAGPLVYVSAVHFLLLTETRQSLPVKPLAIVLAVAGTVHVIKWWRGAKATAA